MKQIFFDAKGQLYLQDVPAPECGPGQVLVRVTHSLISSGTESMSLAGGGNLLKQALRRPDLVRRTVRFAAKHGVQAAAGLVRESSERWLPAGYSAAGTIIEVGEGVTSFAIRDRVACAGAGYANHAEFIAVPVNLVVKIPSSLPFREACFATLGSIALQGVRRVQPTLGETVVVVGTGLIGLLTSQLLRANGCRVICTDVAPERLRLARELGFEHTLDVGAADVVQAVVALTGGHGADAVIVTAATQSSEPVNQSFQMSRERGRVVVVGAVGMDLLRDDFYRKEIDVRMSRSYGPGRYDPDYEERGQDYPLGYVRWTETRNLAAFLELVASGQVDVAPLISAEYSIDRAIEAYQRVTDADAATIGVLLTYPVSRSTEPPDRTWRLLTTMPAMEKGHVGLVLVGAGDFARAMHIPNLKALSGHVSVRAVVSGSGGSACQAAEMLGAPIATTDLAEALAVDGVDAVLIATRHHLHAPQCLASAYAGKHIFVEKPLGLTGDECRTILTAVEQFGVLCTVGFNRRFGRLAQALRQALVDVPGPKHIIYRVNAGMLPKTHWLLDPDVGGGRILGEGCHFFDLMAWLSGADPVSVWAQAVGDSPDDVAAMVKFSDSSVGTLIYTGLGDPSFPKERIEIFAGGGVAILDDFRLLTLSGLAGKSLKLRTQDKGHRSLLDRFLRTVSGQDEMTVTARDGLVATLCAEAAISSLALNQAVEIV